MDRVSILLVDDHPENLLALEAVLSDPGYDLVRATSGEEALRQILRHDFGVILLDAQMPGMDGFETAQLIRTREKARDIPIIFITGLMRDMEHISRAYALDAVDYLLKPFDPEILRTKVAVLAELHRKTAQVEQQAELLRQSEMHLSQLVRERTAELEEANRDLEQEIAERKQAEENLKATLAELERSNKELELFAYVASHDLQEPLRMVASYVQLLAQRYQDKLDGDADEFIGYAVDGAHRMQQLINDLLNYSRVGTRAKEFGPTDCEVVLDQVLANLRMTVEENGVTVTHDALPTVMADDVQIIQLFQNLIGNAIKFRSHEPPEIHVAAGRQAEWGDWQFSVRDNGIGLDPQFAERIFVIFQRLHHISEYPGTGMGLAICRKIVQRHGGRIWVESQPGEGATFYFTLSANER